MADTTFVNQTTLSDEDWFNDLNRLHYTIFGDPADLATLRATLTKSGTAVATTSGTAHTFSSIPTGIKYIAISLAGVSTNGTSGYMIQIGDSGGLENGSYAGSDSDAAGSDTAAYNSGFVIYNTPDATSTVSGICTLVLLDSSTNTWAESHNMSGTSAGTVRHGAGSKSLSGTLDRVSLTTVTGTPVFDAGKVNILYW